MAFVGIATIVGIGEVVVKFDVNAGSKKKLDFVKVSIPSKFYFKLFKLFVVVVDLFTFYAFKNVVFPRTIIYIKIAISVRQRAVSFTKIAVIHEMITNGMYATSGIVIMVIIIVMVIIIGITTRAFSRRYGLK